MLLTNQNCVGVGFKGRLNFVFLFAVTILNSETNRSLFLPGFYMDVKLGLSHGRRNIG